MENMEWKETENATQSVVERMETSMSSMEQMSFDAINITDSLVTLTSKAKEYASLMKNGDAREREDSFEEIEKILDKVLETAFQVNNVSHELEQEVIYQRDTTANIRQIIDFLLRVIGQNVHFCFCGVASVPYTDKNMFSSCRYRSYGFYQPCVPDSALPGQMP